MTTTVWICEKPSQASDIAKVLGIKQRSNGYIQTNQGIVTWGYGHLLEQFSPEDYDESLKKWAMESLPIIPELWQMKPTKGGSKQLKVIASLLKKTKKVVVATDADREGEAIGRELLEYFSYDGDIQRLWLSALDETSVKRALQKLLPGDKTHALYEAAKARSRADWLYGMNLTRAASLTFQSAHVLSVGRVQTPTLALVVRRDQEIENFSSKHFYELIGYIHLDGHTIALTYQPPSSPDDKRIYDKKQAEDLAGICDGKASMCKVITERKKQAPPKLFSLSGLQKECNKQWGWSADHTLKVAQSLYETHKATSYPRSDCTFLPEEQKSDISTIVRHLAHHEKLRDAIPLDTTIRKSVFNTKKVTAHHAIIPTCKRIDMETLSKDEKQAYVLIAKRYLMNISQDFVYDETTLSVIVEGISFYVKGKVTVNMGWKISHESDDKDSILPHVEDGMTVTLRDVGVIEKKTSPPKPYTEGTLIADMASVAKFVQEPDLKARLKETSGIGTEATRASIIEVLKRRNYVEIKGKSIISTGAGKALIHALPASISDPGGTAVWEDALEEVAQAKLSSDTFVQRISSEVNALVRNISSVQDVTIGERKKNPPTVKMLALAKKIAKNKGKRLPKGAASSFDVCKAFLDKHTTQNKSSKPSDKQIAFAERLAKKSGKDLPKDYRNDRRVCSQFIDQILKG